MNTDTINDNTFSQSGEPASAPLHCPTKPPCRILVVDNDSDVRQLSAHALVGSGYHVDAVEDKAAAWKALQLKAYNLLITDTTMPTLSGVGLVEKLRSARMALPVIRATERSPTGEQPQLPSLHPAVMLPKPFSIDELLYTVRDVLRDTVRAPDRLSHGMTVYSW